MAFPAEIITFPTMLDITESDCELIAQYQTAIQNQDLETAGSILEQIENYSLKIISASYLNSLSTTIHDIEQFYLARYSSAYIVSATQPLAQESTDFWFEITGVSS